MLNTKNSTPQPTKLLSVGGSDSGGAAGIQADLKTWTVLGVYGMSALTAVTAQNSLTVAGVQFAAPDFLALQIRTVLDDYGADGIKTGFIGRIDLIHAIAQALQHVTCPIIVDPILVNHRGEAMFSAEIAIAYRTHLFPLAHLITPNRHEAALLTGKPLLTVEDAERAVRQLSLAAATAVLLTGVPEAGNILDLLAVSGEVVRFSAETIPTRNTHGSGDTLSAAIATYLAQGDDLTTAINRARAFTQAAIRAAADWQLGAGHGPLWHSAAP
ncbi:MAG: bifunctional hydroxymethylpyrimidine kinase/phosphomethylpyrimidine kinase [Anaerolineae bacterium]|nr:bifunctional hydroxymethylpyrimidine kinase/phosphomethylpyrimidine kinase [Anaerolineae bacterium]MCO5203691.1 bifunctional hydroxymethylpyrimidine kinase/phosphomethylpyrimidine kinase [Anaerolineae bacterium]